MKVQESTENYLETILILKNKHGNVRSIDIANELEFSKPSISVAIKNLKAKGLATVDTDGFITLTDEGEKIAKKMYERHRIISNWLISLNVDEETATQDACRIEHVISEKTFKAIKEHAKVHGVTLVGKKS